VHTKKRGKRGGKCLEEGRGKALQLLFITVGNTREEKKEEKGERNNQMLTRIKGIFETLPQK